MQEESKKDIKNTNMTYSYSLFLISFRKNNINAIH
jgi:hypothetical protein